MHANLSLTLLAVLAGAAPGGFAASAPASDGSLIPPPHPTVLDLPYSADDPPGPAFTEDEKQRQLTDGLRLRSEILAAFAAGRDCFVVPPGDYRFGADWQASESSFVLRNLRRPEERPFRILAQGATFWFTLGDRPAPFAHRMVQILGCSHLSLEGLTIDSDPRACMDARVTAFDFAGNRIQVQPLPGTRLLTRIPEAENRFVPFKANGRHIAALYRIDADWGPGNVFYKDLVPTEDGRFWLTLKTGTLLRTLQDPAWRAAYGPGGVLETGDVLGILYNTSVAIWLSECREITVRNCRVYAAKACLSETGGYGGHRWIQCHFMARPGTNQLLGGDGTMNNACQHGSTFDGLVIQRITDDGFNNHGYWYQAEAAPACSLTFAKDLPALPGPGDRAEIYDALQKRFLGSCTVATSAGRSLSFQETPFPLPARATVLFPGFQNAGWVVRNCSFVDCYQRILLQCGPGLFENNRVERTGAGLEIQTGLPGHIEGGCPDGIVVRDNLFLDTSVSPPNSAIHVTGRARPLRGLRLENNLIAGSGREAVTVSDAAELELSGNVFVHPFRGAPLLPAASVPARPAVRLARVQGARFSDNAVVQTEPSEGDRDLVVQTGCPNLRLGPSQFIADPERRVETLVRQLAKNHALPASAIVRQIKAGL